MLKVTIEPDGLRFGKDFALSFQRTLRIPDDGKTYPLPPGLGPFPVLPVDRFRDRLPAHMAEQSGAFIPMYQREALWIRFEGRHWKPNAVKVGIGRVNAVSGRLWHEYLEEEEEDYLVCPPQPWLDGINAGEGMIRQFVAMPLGMGYTVEAQVTGEERFGGMQVVVYEPKPGRFPDEPPPSLGVLRAMAMPWGVESRSPALGLAAGGRMRQKIYPDPHGLDTWDQGNYGSITVHIVNSLTYRAITGEEPPPTPVSAQTYTRYGLPWFDLYDEQMGDIAAPEALQQVQSVKEIDQELGAPPQPDDTPLDLSQEQIVKYGMDEAATTGKPPSPNGKRDPASSKRRPPHQ